MKTRLFTRKRALISSVAMLLVAMIALGTATFAWFVADPTATATGLKMKTVSGSGLVVLSESQKHFGGTYSHATVLNAKDASTANSADFTITPASFNYDDTIFGTNVKSIDAASDNNYAADTTKDVATVTRGGWDTDATSLANGGYYMENIYCKVTGGADTADMSLTGLSISFNAAATDVKNALRVVVTKTDGSVAGTYGIDAEGNAYIISTGTTYQVKENEGTPVKYTQTTQAATLATPVSLGDANAAGDAVIKVFVYLDGEDSDCYSRIANATELVSNVQVSLALTDSI